MSLLFRVAIVCALLLSVPAATAQLQLREVEATGHGSDAGEATRDALENAIAQVGGQRLSSATSMALAESTRDGATRNHSDFNQRVEKITRGVVKSYTVLESGQVPASGRSFVRIRATVPIFASSEQLKRMRVAVVPVSLAQALAASADATAFAEAVSAAAEAGLTQTRRFAMLDRRHAGTSDQELRRVAGPGHAIEESARLGARAGADVLVLLHLASFSAREVEQRSPSGRMSTAWQAPVTLQVRVLDVASGQVKFAQHLSPNGRLPARYGLNRFAADIGAEVAQLIAGAVYPLAVVAASDDEVTLNQGGDSVQVGRRYRLVRLGAELTDPHTRESLGRQETEVARAEVTSVTDRSATARLIAGQLPAKWAPGSLWARPLPDELSLPPMPGLTATATAHQEPPAATGGSMNKDTTW